MLSNTAMGKTSAKKLEKQTQAPDAPKFIRFESHDEALAALSSMGIFDASKTQNFMSDSLVKETNLLLKEFTLMDVTSVVPCTAHAAYQALTVAAFHAQSSSRKDNKAAFLILRTAENTPSFLFGWHFSLLQSIGKEAADLRVATYPTPSGLLIYGDRQLFLPKLVGVPLELASKCIVNILEPQHSSFACAFCQSSFVKISNDAHVRVDEVARLSDGTLLKRGCVDAFLAARENQVV